MSIDALHAACFPKMRMAGDGAVLVEFGAEMDLHHSFTAIARKRDIQDAGVHGIVEVTQGLTSLLVQFDPGATSADNVMDALTEVLSGAAPNGDVVDSRLVRMPVLYNDPWTKQCIDDYRKRIGPVEDNLETVAKVSGLDDTDEVVRLHSRTTYWVAGLGTWPGLPFNFPMNPNYRLQAPKYNPARTWTPEGAIGFGGSCTSIYSIESPGGYQLLGRTPVPIWRVSPPRPWDEDQPALFRAGDRVRFVPIERDEYDEIRVQVSRGTYEVAISSPEPVSAAEFETAVEAHAKATP